MTGNRARPVGLGEAVVGGSDAVFGVHGLGSCVAIILYDADAVVGGVVHVVLPSRSLSRDQTNPARFAESAVPHLVGKMRTAGADLRRMTARLVGGASMFAALTPAGTVHIGQRNLVTCRLALRAASIAIVGEAVGGERGRSLRFEVETGQVTVRSVGYEPESL